MENIHKSIIYRVRAGLLVMSLLLIAGCTGETELNSNSDSDSGLAANADAASSSRDYNRDSALSIEEASWDRGDRRLSIKGKGRDGQRVNVVNAGTGQLIGSDRVDDEEWRVRKSDLALVPCRIRAEQEDGLSAELDVKDAPQSCDGSVGGTGDSPVASHYRLEEAYWDDEDNRVTVKGKGDDNRLVTVFNASSNQPIGSDRVDGEEWKVRVSDLSIIPCRIRAQQEGDPASEINVKDAPANCDGDAVVDGGDGNTGGGAVSGSFTILAANDLGMHCADQDYRIFSILPPYNVLNAQVLQKGREPRLMSPADGIRVTYKSVDSNFFTDLTDALRLPDATDSLSLTSQNPAGIFKSNFWDVAQPSGSGIDKTGFQAYESLYPPGILSAFSSAADTGLPAPNLTELYLGGGTLQAEQAAMPGATNSPQQFHGYVESLPFFTGFPFGFTVDNFNRFTAEGIPITALDDKGRSNPYPLMRVEARDAEDNVLASVDTVVPVASEADCAICHASQEVCDIDNSNALACDDIANANYPAELFVQDALQAEAVIGATAEQRVINSAKINIVRLHDYKHQTTLAGSEADGTNGATTPNVVCASCHYSPALDLAQLGPNDDNGKQQTQHVSMSRAMHQVHGELPLSNEPLYRNLFPVMPPPGASRDPLLAEEILMNTCYNCHPGKKARCLRGAMGGSGTVCQDCHGQLTQVGDDFSEGFPDLGFPAGANLNKRVPWGSEPSCDSCHVGDVMQVAALQQSGALNDVVVSARDDKNNRDGLRLLMSYKLSDHKSNGGPDNLSIMRFPASRFATTEALYRLSGADNSGSAGLQKGHGGLSCEGCHGSTHAIWPNKNPYANDNKAANDIQGHSGPIIECASCHEGDLGNTLDGPHGMHPVGNSSFSDGGHEDMAENNGNACRSCHGRNGEGSVLARAARNRSLSNEGATVNVLKGQVITCNLCHENEL